MRHPLIVRALLGGIGLAGCVALLSGVARAADATLSAAAPIIVRAVAPSNPPQMFGTVTLPIKPQQYYEDWERARRDDSSDPRMRLLIAPARGLNPDQQIYFVQKAVGRLVRWRSDATEWGYHDYWASAAETLQHGYGDDEDRAIVKMQALRALGFSTHDLYLTMGHDVVGGPVTVLIVRFSGRYYVLDDTGGPPFTSDRRPEFRPILTFGYGGFWIHGHRTARTATVTAASAASAAGNRK